MRSQHISFRLALIGLSLALCVVMLGAYTRLKDAGLGCPDWPGCYGSLVVQAHQAADQTKAWTEMIHRYAAGCLGILILGLWLLAWRQRQVLRTAFYVASILLIAVIFQALLGMWTVTLYLLPVVVLAHLLGGILIFSLLGCLAQSFTSPLVGEVDAQRRVRGWALLALIVLILQISLGGWTSSQYASVACPDFPMCQGQWLPPLDFKNALNIFQPIGLPYEGGTLDNAARVTIHLMHRVGAIISLLVLGGLGFYLGKRGRLLLLLLGVQISLGIANILFHIPLSVAVAHTGVAALLLLTVVLLNFRLYALR